ncbi:MAG: HoxN/HupN/NixA family nickel/cobalt transporter [Solirubrobacterales bacterium]|nr:HoxN/HupN/NixA family nickel/cobalt transporter [Solirubrobacterales bacterium]
MTASRFLRGWRSFSAQEKRDATLMLATVAGLNIAGWGLFALAIMPHHFHYAGLGVGVGVAVTAWTLGARHAFDADHIAAIDNSTRKLLADRPQRRPLGTGFFFALGHSTVMLVVGVATTIASKSVFHAVVRPSSSFEVTGGAVGTVTSATFLWLIAGLNLVVLAGIWRVFREMRRGNYNEEQLETHLQARGFMNRFFGAWMGAIKHSWQLFGVGFLFGIGFDTATEVLLLAGTAAAATQGLPFYAVLALPLLFAGGMTLFDSFDGFFMNTAYGWAFARPVRKVYYNLAITGLSVAIAFVVGGIEIIGVLSDELHWNGWLADFVGGLDLNTVGYIVVGLFVVVWGGALAFWKLGRVEERWEAGLDHAG